MVHVSRSDQTIIFEVQGLHKLWALKSRLEIPRSHIRRARGDPSAARGWKGWKIPGTYIPGIITAGTYYSNGERTFWDVSRAKDTVVVELRDDYYDRLVIEVPDVEDTVRLLNAER